MKHNSTSGLTPIASAVALLVLSASMSAQAQQAQQPAAQEVVVTGIRASMQNAVNIKRNSNSVVDAVSAEDIGKMPDTDVGESLGRVPGVSVGRAFGQGASVSVRGSDPQMTYTTLNGQTIASTGWYDQQSIDRSFNYSLLPSELIGGIEVYKSSQADLTEGGIGGTVIVKTRKPLDMPSGSAFIGAKIGKGTVSTELDKDVSGLYSWKNEANTFGVLVGGAVENGEYIRRGIESDSRWSGDVAPTTFVQERKRQAFNLNLQARPTKDLDLGLNYLKLKLTGDNSNTSQYVFQNTYDPAAKTGFNNCTSLNAAGVCTSSTTTAATANNAFLQTWARTAEMTSDSLNLNGTYKGNGFKLDAVAGSTKADGGTSETTNYAYYSGDATGPNLPKWTGNINATGKQIIMTPSSPQDVALANLPGSIGPSGSWATSKGPNTDKENYAQADLLLNLDWASGISSFKTGFRVSDHTFEKSSYRANFAATTINAPTASLYSGTIAMGPNGWSNPKPNIDAMMANTNQNITGWTYDRSGYGKLEEKNTAIYGMFNFEKEQWHGNFGARYISTDATGTGYAFNGTPLAAGDIGNNNGWSNSLTSQTAKYNDVLPSLNIAYDLNKNTILRLAASQAVTRPNFDNMFLATETGYQDKTAGNETITYGSVALKPMKSTQLDLSVEYYYGKGNLLSLTYFHKDINNFITTQTAVNQSIGVVSPDSGKDSWTVNRYVNAGGGKIDGLEAQINHSFDNGFGVVANYTLANATAPATSYQDQLNVFTQSSKHNVNLLGYWESPQYFARAAYNWRSEYMLRETGWYGNRMHDSYGTLDASIGWNVTDKIRLTLEATNLLKADDVQYGAASTTTTVKVPLQAGYPAWSFKGETTYRLSVSAKF
ncbi:TonB-dependent receptor [Undibacterium sp. Dicai25W]|uniref:TonB-dependent receptor n=1 Tax=Undibacterium sp. Dicai25W TaxID=3413034 RepID=UPI003BF03A21